MKSLRTFSIILIILLFSGCHHLSRKPGTESGRAVEVKILPYGLDLFALDPFNLEPGLDSLKKRYSFFLGNELDAQKIMQIRDFITDPLNRELAEKCAERYYDITFLEKGLEDLFSRCRTNLPGFKDPAVYTYVSGLLYEMPVQYPDSALVIGLDMFLGKDFEPYRAVGLPAYMTRRMEKENILPECARQIAMSRLPAEGTPKSLLDYMILEGKILYAMDRLLPSTADSLKIGYTSDQIDWCLNNEKNIWRMMIDQELLYSPDPKTVYRFIQDGPFTAGMPEGAPAMLGKWVGWQIVRSYMQKNEGINITDLFNATDSQIILSQSGYKPRK
jgi:hypothetical protein